MACHSGQDRDAGGTAGREAGDGAPTLYLVDDDRSVLRALSRLVAGAGFDVRPFSSSRDFLLHHDPNLAGCALLDLTMPDVDGLSLQRSLAACGRQVIFLTGRGDVSTSVRAMKAGAVDFLTKPARRENLLDAVERALDRDREMRAARDEREQFGRRLGSLTPRERQVFDLVAAGRLNKQVAGTLGTAEKTVKVHRARVMEKLGVRSVVDLARIADRAAGMTGRTDPIVEAALSHPR